MRTLVTAMAIPISATLRPLTFLFDSVVFRTGIACLVVVGAVQLAASLSPCPAALSFAIHVWRVDRSVGQNVAHTQQVETNRRVEPWNS
jgi:hypothetical protein